MKKNRLFWLVAIIGLVLDQLTKYWIVQNFELCEDLSLWNNVFHLKYVINTGAAFSSFSQHEAECSFPGEGQGVPIWLSVLSLIVSAGLMVFGFTSQIKKIEQIGFGLILAGALGNGIDRFFSGYVVDFLRFPFVKIPVLNTEFPVFNLADTSISIGIIFLLIATFPGKKQKNEPKVKN